MTGPRNTVAREVGFGLDAADADEARARAFGLQLMPRGRDLAEYVARQMPTVTTAATIARTVGYTVTRCAQMLAHAGHAPLARRLLDRDAVDAAFAAYEPMPDPEPALEPRTNRPAPTGDEILWELEDAHLRGDTFADVAEMFGVGQPALRRWVRRRGIVAQVEAYYPRRVAGVASAVLTTRRCSRGHNMVATPGQRARCRECKRASEKRRRRAA
jgi:hypothetical protein